VQAEHQQDIHRAGLPGWHVVGCRAGNGGTDDRFKGQVVANARESAFYVQVWFAIV